MNRRLLAVIPLVATAGVFAYFAAAPPAVVPVVKAIKQYLAKILPSFEKKVEKDLEKKIEKKVIADLKKKYVLLTKQEYEDLLIKIATIEAAIQNVKGNMREMLNKELYRYACMVAAKNGGSFTFYDILLQTNVTCDYVGDQCMCYYVKRLR